MKAKAASKRVEAGRASSLPRRQAAPDGQGCDHGFPQLLHLQRAAGNRAVNALLGEPLQRQPEAGEAIQAKGGEGAAPSEAGLKKRFNLFQLINGLLGPSESVGEAGEDPKAAERTEQRLINWAKKKYRIYLWNSGAESLWKVPK